MAGMAIQSRGRTSKIALRRRDAGSLPRAVARKLEPSGPLSSPRRGLLRKARPPSPQPTSQEIADGAAGAGAPIVKWAGGKSRLLDELIARAPARYRRYFEPF